MKTKKLLIPAAVALGGLLILQSWTNNPSSINNGNKIKLSAPGEVVPDDRSRSCNCQPGYFKIGDYVCVDGTLDRTTTNIGNDTLDVHYSDTVKNYPNWTSCDPTVDIDLSSNVEEVYANSNITRDSITVYGYVPKLKVSEESTLNPDVYAYTTGADNDTLYVILSHDSGVSYKSKRISFKIKSKKGGVKFYSLKEDPRTSRGTVTNVQTTTSIDTLTTHLRSN